MSYIIENNAFSGDTYGVRSTRLLMVSANIDDYAVELEIEAGMLSWAQNAYQDWQDKLADKSVERGEKLEAYQTRDEASDALYDKYVRAKELLITRYGPDDQNLATYGVDVSVPTRKPDIINKAYELIRGNETQTAAGDPKALPAGMINNLKTLTDDAADKQEIAKKEKSEMKAATQALHDIYDADSDMLSSLLQWTLMYWAKNDPRLELFGFVPYQAHGGGHTPDAPQNLGYDSVMSRFSWMEADGATSYQLAYRETGSDDEWQAAYSGPDTSAAFNPGGGNWRFKVRARNEHGYGDWSGAISVEIVGGIAAPEWLTAVYVPAPFPIPTPPPKILPEHVLLEWANIAEATMYEVWRSVVNVGEAAGTFTILEEHDSELYHDFAVTLNKRNYYYIVAKNATDRSVASVEAWAEVVE